MAKALKLNGEKLAEEVGRLLRRGPMTAREICAALSISQAAFSRISVGMKQQLLVLGQARHTRYALGREIPDVGTALPLYRIDTEGKAKRAGVLRGIHPRGFYWEEGDGKVYPDLPYFLDDVRPGGFLGRLLPRQHPELGLPTDIHLWSADQCLRYLSVFGWNLIGAWVIGERAFQAYLERQQSLPESVPLASRAKRYAEMAADVMGIGDGGSSAAGEQPKFVATKGPRHVPVIVKFSPKERSELSQRRADLLVCEAIALETLGRYGKRAAKAELLWAGGRTFLEVERFDRVGPRGRKGMLSLRALDQEFTGKLQGWSAAGRELFRIGKIDAGIRREIEWLELFGKLIANTDMHLANLSVFEEDLRVTELTPVYDMLPMQYAPQNEQLVERDFQPAPPSPEEGDLWRDVCPAARDFWAAVSRHEKISKGFRGIARSNERKLVKLEKLTKLLPSSTGAP